MFPNRSAKSNPSLRVLEALPLLKEMRHVFTGGVRHQLHVFVLRQRMFAIEFDLPARLRFATLRVKLSQQILPVFPVQSVKNFVRIIQDNAWPE